MAFRCRRHAREVTGGASVKLETTEGGGEEDPSCPSSIPVSVTMAPSIPSSLLPWYKARVSRSEMEFSRDGRCSWDRLERL